jgi:hypothetical protein
MAVYGLDTSYRHSARQEVPANSDTGLINDVSEDHTGMQYAR